MRRAEFSTQEHTHTYIYMHMHIFAATETFSHGSHSGYNITNRHQHVQNRNNINNNNNKSSSRQLHDEHLIGKLLQEKCIHQSGIGQSHSYLVNLPDFNGPHEAILLALRLVPRRRIVRVPEASPEAQSLIGSGRHHRISIGTLCHVEYARRVTSEFRHLMEHIVRARAVSPSRHQ